MSRNASRNVEYAVVPFAVAVAHYMLFGQVMGHEKTDTQESVEAIDKLGHFWLIEAVANHPGFDTLVNASANGPKEDIDTAVTFFATTMLGAVGGIFGIADLHVTLQDKTAEAAQSRGLKVGKPVDYSVQLDDEGHFSYATKDGTCPDCGKDHSEFSDILDNIAKKFGAKITTVEAKVDAQGNITNLDDIPEHLRESIVAKVKEMAADVLASKARPN